MFPLPPQQKTTVKLADVFANENFKITRSIQFCVKVMGITKENSTVQIADETGSGKIIFADEAKGLLVRLAIGKVYTLLNAERGEENGVLTMGRGSYAAEHQGPPPPEFAHLICGKTALTFDEVEAVYQGGGDRGKTIVPQDILFKVHTINETSHALGTGTPFKKVNLVDLKGNYKLLFFWREYFRVEQMLAVGEVYTGNNMVKNSYIGRDGKEQWNLSYHGSDTTTFTLMKDPEILKLFKEFPDTYPVMDGWVTQFLQLLPDTKETNVLQDSAFVVVNFYCAHCKQRARPYEGESCTNVKCGKPFREDEIALKWFTFLLFMDGEQGDCHEMIAYEAMWQKVKIPNHVTQIMQKSGVFPPRKLNLSDARDLKKRETHLREEARYTLQCIRGRAVNVVMKPLDERNDRKVLMQLQIKE